MLRQPEASYEDFLDSLEEEVKHIKQTTNGRDLKEVYGEIDGEPIQSFWMEQYQRKHNIEPVLFDQKGLTEGYIDYVMKQRDSLRNVEGMVNSLADFQAIYMENAKENQRDIGIAKSITAPIKDVGIYLTRGNILTSFEKENTHIYSKDVIIENAKLRLVGASPETAIASADINPNQDFNDILNDIQQVYGLNPLLNYKLLFKSKVITDFSQLIDLEYDPKQDIISVMAEQAAASPEIRDSRLIDKILTEFQSSSDDKGRKSFLLSFEGVSLNSPLAVFRKIDRNDLNNFEFLALLKGINQNPNFYLTLAECYSKPKKAKTPNGNIPLDQELLDKFRIEILENIETLTGKSSDELREISPKAFDDIKNYFEKSRYTNNREFAEKYLEGGFFDMLLKYYVEYELPAQIWASYVESDPKTYAEFKDNYFETWDNSKNSEAKKLQKIIWAVLLDFRNPYNGERMEDKNGNPQIRWWMSGEFNLHHWMTGEGVENKYNCIFLATIPLPMSNSFSSFVHNDIHKTFKGLEGDELTKQGTTWQTRFNNRLSIIFKGEFPKDYWIENERKRFDDYRLDQNNIAARKLISWFLISSNTNLMKQLELSSSDFRF